jgi:hypothetical protein
MCFTFCNKLKRNHFIAYKFITTASAPTDALEGGKELKAFINRPLLIQEA